MLAQRQIVVKLLELEQSGIQAVETFAMWTVK